MVRREKMRDKARREMLEDIEHMLTLLLSLKRGLEDDENAITVSSYMFRLVDMLCNTELNLYNYFASENEEEKKEND